MRSSSERDSERVLLVLSTLVPCCRRLTRQGAGHQWYSEPRQRCVVDQHMQHDTCKLHARANCDTAADGRGGDSGHSVGALRATAFKKCNSTEPVPLLASKARPSVAPPSVALQTGHGVVPIISINLESEACRHRSAGGAAVAHLLAHRHGLTLRRSCSRSTRRRRCGASWQGGQSNWCPQMRLLMRRPSRQARPPASRCHTSQTPDRP